jgi:hypothetical protein
MPTCTQRVEFGLRVRLVHACCDWAAPNLRRRLSYSEQNDRRTLDEHMHKNELACCDATVARQSCDVDQTATRHATPAAGGAVVR